MMNNDDKNVLIKYRLTEAKETISDVELLIENERLRAAVNRIYYGMFYALLALGIAYQFETSKHKQLMGWFNKRFIHGDLIDKEFGRYINKAFNRRTKGDCDSFVTFEKETILEMYEDMKSFIGEIQSFIEKS